MSYLKEFRHEITLVAVVGLIVAVVGWTVGEPVIVAEQQFATSRTDNTALPAVADVAATAGPQGSVSFPGPAVAPSQPPDQG